MFKTATSELISCNTCSVRQTSELAWLADNPSSLCSVPDHPMRTVLYAGPCCRARDRERGINTGGCRKKDGLTIRRPDWVLCDWFTSCLPFMVASRDLEYFSRQRFPYGTISSSGLANWCRLLFTSWIWRYMGGGFVLICLIESTCTSASIHWLRGLCSMIVL